VAAGRRAKRRTGRANCLGKAIALSATSLPPSGIELLTQLRERGLNLPVVFLTGHSLNQREALAFDRGGADFVDKARSVEVLVRRLKLLVKTTAHDPPTEKQLVRGKLILRSTVSRAYWRETDVRLTVGSTTWFSSWPPIRASTCRIGPGRAQPRPKFTVYDTFSAEN
jgi:DNA-binding response OmpR family regulator